jgi:hypothetical protein
MKIVEFPTRTEEVPDHAGERLGYQLAQSKILEEAEGDYALFFDVGDSIFVFTNCDGAGEVLLTIEKGKMAVMAAVYEKEDDK